jgi:hypothetical protein
VATADIFRVTSAGVGKPYDLRNIARGTDIRLYTKTQYGWVPLKAHAITSTAKPLVGITGSSNTTFNDINTLVGPVLARRSYDSTLPSSWQTSNGNIDVAAGRTSVWGWHPDTTTFPSSTSQQDAFSAFLDTIPATHRVYITAKHEPEDSITQGTFTLAQWGATLTKIGQIVRGKGRPLLQFGPTFQGTWTFDTRSPYDTYDWRSVLDLAYVDYVGLDPYRTSSGTAATWEQMMTVGNSGSSSSIRSTMDTMIDWGKPVMLSEFGVFNKPGDTPTISEAQKIAFIQGAYSWAKSWNLTHPVGSPGFVIGMIYFNLTLIGSDVMLSTTAQQQAYAAIVADSKVA